MELLSVNCNHCGAALQVPPDARFVTCRYCNSQLEIKRSDSAITTQVLQRINQNTASMAQDLHAIRRATELDRLDREWAQRQRELMIRDKRGNTSRPSAVGGMIMAVLTGGFGIFWSVMAFSMTSPHTAPSFEGFRGGPGLPPSPVLTPSSSSDPTAIAHVVMPLFGIVFIAFAIGIGIKTVIIAGKYDKEERLYQSRRAELLNGRTSIDAPTRHPRGA